MTSTMVGPVGRLGIDALATAPPTPLSAPKAAASAIIRPRPSVHWRAAAAGAMMTELAGYTDSENLRPAQLSSGEQKMVSFARAIVTEPHLIFLDDPTIAVDHEGVDKILKIIRQLKEDRRTLIISTHDPMLSSMVADNLVIMKKGQIIEHGTFKEVVRSENREVVRILSDVLSETSTYAGDILDLMDDGVINDSS